MILPNYFPAQRAAALSKVAAVDAMTQAVTHFREAAFEAVCGDILAAFAGLPALTEVRVRYGAVTLEAFGLNEEPAGEPEERGDISLKITLAPSLAMTGASVAEWDASPAAFFARYFPLRKMGLGTWHIRRDDAEVRDFLAWCERDDTDYPAYRHCLLPLMLKAQLSFGYFFLHHDCQVQG
ncbi:hypothetical protein [Duganella levis]|uniref:Uncharacterized protein n=1 Tax=Duganella levis TaxID=2692169 RepID=A0ABW9VZ74_9BURK|nr:hypothetical protein [Duganella levis]MYN26935.1 hypothetical protein [Duganella levis]